MLGTSMLNSVNTSMLNASNYYRLEEKSLNNKEPFDEVIPLYRQVCRNINLSHICIPHFTTTLLYLILPANVRNNAVNAIYDIISRNQLFNRSVNELLEVVEITELLQRDYSVDVDNLLRFNDKQLKMLYAMFYESLYEISIDNRYKLSKYF
jgi:hypothetical protein